MSLKIFKKNEKDERDDDLRRKWGRSDPAANEALERTRQMTLKMITWDRLGPEVKEYWTMIRDFERKWQNGEVHRWQDYFVVPGS